MATETGVIRESYIALAYNKVSHFLCDLCRKITEAVTEFFSPKWEAVKTAFSNCCDMVSLKLGQRMYQAQLDRLERARLHEENRYKQTVGEKDQLLKKIDDLDARIRVLEQKYDAAQLEIMSLRQPPPIVIPPSAPAASSPTTPPTSSWSFLPFWSKS
jgi:hypothetical protein